MENEGDDDFSDFDDNELDSLYQKNINKNIKETIIRRSVPVQRDLYNNIPVSYTHLDVYKRQGKAWY